MIDTSTLATVLAIGLAVAAVGTLAAGRHVLSGTLFLFTAFALYIREVTG
ncbi:MAG: hypothetical protein PPP58_08645 [Natronomonas sp.]